MLGTVAYSFAGSDLLVTSAAREMHRVKAS